MTTFRTHAGQIQGGRDQQEDAFAVERFSDGEVLVGVADGLGGHPAGDVASHEGLKEFVREFCDLRGQDKGTPRHWLDESVHAAQRHLLKKQRDNTALFGMATTLVAVYVKGKTLWATSVGDSYLLRLRRGSLIVLNELHGENGGVTSAIGFNLAQVDMTSQQIEPGDRFLLATDGILTLSDADMVRLLGSAADPAKVVEALLAKVESRALPYQDNVTVVAVFL